MDSLGLDYVDETLLKTIIEKFGGGPVGLDTLAASIGEDRNTIEDVYEPYLIQLGFINRGARGRMAMPKAYKHLNYPLICKLDYYTNDELAQIVKRSSGLVGADIDEKSAAEIARRSRGTPRIANRLCRRDSFKNNYREVWWRASWSGYTCSFDR